MTQNIVSIEVSVSSEPIKRSNLFDGHFIPATRGVIGFECTLEQVAMLFGECPVANFAIICVDLPRAKMISNCEQARDFFSKGDENR